MEKLQCSVCGGALVMSDDGEKAVCESCGMSFKKETVKKMIMELSGPVKVEGIQNSDSLADRAETFLRMGETGKAQAAFRQMADEYPSDYRGWWGLTRTMDWEKYFHDGGLDEAVMPQTCQRAIDFAPEGTKEEIRAYFEERVRSVKPDTDKKLQQEAVEQAEHQAAKQAEQAAREASQQKIAIYQQAVKQAERRVEEARNRVSYLELTIRVNADQIKDERKLTNNQKTGDRRPITLGNILGLFFGGALTYVVWFEEFHPIGTPIATLIGLGLPLLFIIRRLNRTKGHFDRASELKQELKQAQQELPEARKALEEAKAALAAVKEARPN